MEKEGTVIISLPVQGEKKEGRADWGCGGGGRKCGVFGAKTLTKFLWPVTRLKRLVGFFN